MHHHDGQVERFEQQRPRLRAVAYRMLGSLSDAEDAVQEVWLRLNRTDTSGVENLEGWLTTVMARVCLNLLRSRRISREQAVGVRMPEPIVNVQDEMNPEQQALLAAGVGFALLVVLEALSPAERVAFVMHDTFDVPFDEIASILGRSPAAARQLASRARRRVRDAIPVAEPDLRRQREVVNAFSAASRDGDFDALLAVLDPDVVLRAQGGPAGTGKVVRGADGVAGQAMAFETLSPFARPALVNGAAGIVVISHGQPLAVLAFTIASGRIVAIDVLADPERLQQLEIAGLDG
jgi:RNA polymerase sigma factor (sigma-70 family)